MTTTLSLIPSAIELTDNELEAIVAGDAGTVSIASSGISVAGATLAGVAATDGVATALGATVAGAVVGAGLAVSGIGLVVAIGALAWYCFE